MSELEGGSSNHRNVCFEEAIDLGINNYFQFSGRSSRGAYWWWWLASVILGFVASLFDLKLLNVNGNSIGAIGPFAGFVALITIIPNLAVLTRRLHDVGRSGWWVLLVFTGIGAILVLSWLNGPGDRKENRYGPDFEAGRNQEVLKAQIINCVKGVRHHFEKMRVFAKERPVLFGKYCAIILTFMDFIFPPWANYGEVEGMRVKIESGHHFLFSGPIYTDIDYRKMFFIAVLIWLTYATLRYLVNRRTK